MCLQFIYISPSGRLAPFEGSTVFIWKACVCAAVHSLTRPGAHDPVQSCGAHPTPLAKTGNLFSHFLSTQYRGSNSAQRRTHSLDPSNPPRSGSTYTCHSTWLPMENIPRLTNYIQLIMSKNILSLNHPNSVHLCQMYYLSCL